SADDRRRKSKLPRSVRQTSAGERCADVFPQEGRESLVSPHWGRLAGRAQPPIAPPGTARILPHLQPSATEPTFAFNSSVVSVLIRASAVYLRCSSFTLAVTGCPSRMTFTST